MIKRVTIGPSIVLIQDTIAGDEGEWSTSRIWTLEEWDDILLGGSFRERHMEVSRKNRGLVRWYKEK